MFIIYHIFHCWSIHYRRKMDKKYFFCLEALDIHNFKNNLKKIH